MKVTALVNAVAFRVCPVGGSKTSVCFAHRAARFVTLARIGEASSDGAGYVNAEAEPARRVGGIEDGDIRIGVFHKTVLGMTERSFR